MLLQYQNVLSNLKIILASQSKGRKQLLENLQMFQFQVMPSNFEEDLDKSLFQTPKDYVRATCQGKVNELLPRIKMDNIDWDILIFADTICDLNGQIIEKPKSKYEAYQMMQEFNDKWHLIHTCLILVAKRKRDNLIFQVDSIETTQIKVGQLSEQSINAYCEQEDSWRGKAGGYALQGKAAIMIESIKGCHSNVIGLPLYVFNQALCKILDKLQKE